MVYREYKILWDYIYIEPLGKSPEVHSPGIIRADGDSSEIDRRLGRRPGAVNTGAGPGAKRARRRGSRRTVRRGYSSQTWETQKTVMRFVI